MIQLNSINKRYLHEHVLDNITCTLPDTGFVSLIGPSGCGKSTGVTEEVDADLKAVVTSTRDKVAEKMKNLRVADAITEVFNLFRRCNKYIDETAPWVLAKDEATKDRLAEVLYNLVESITIGACLLKSFLPETADRILTQLNTGMREYDDLDKFGLYENGNKVTEKPGNVK